MNIILKQSIESLGYHFIEPQYLPAGENEYYLRNIQNRSNAEYRNLTELEIEELKNNSNTSNNWKDVFVSNIFDTSLIQGCSFHGLIRIGNLEPLYLEFSNLRLPVGLYNSKIIACDFGDNICVDNVNYLSHYILGNEVMLANINEMATTSTAKFGNGIIKQGETEENKIYLELCNENGGRKVAPFNGMLAADAYLWSKYRDDEKLLEKFSEFTSKKFDNRRGYYGKIGDRTVIKNCKILKDVWIGSDAYIKGANKIKNVTINSDAERKTQIGEGCEIVNGIVGYGCRIFYGVKAIRFILASHSQLKYGARLINSYLGNNATVSCCEVLNSLIFPAHEQHHNNSFLCASIVMGQSNIAAGATIGSNHNSRAADGEIIAGRGFWPGLCTSLKHNSKFASFTIIAKGDFPAELNIPIPFSLVSNDVTNDELVIMPAYWMMYNMYALARNEWKAKDRDKRIGKKLTIEYDYLAPDTINEIFNALEILKKIEINENDSGYVTGFENSNRKIKIIKISKAIETFILLINTYAITQIINWQMKNKYKNFEELKNSLITNITRSEWLNIGGQLIQKDAVETFKNNVKKDKIKSWDDVHFFYKTEGNEKYTFDKLTHAYTSLLEINNITTKQFDFAFLENKINLFINNLYTTAKNIVASRAKDYTNPFRLMTYNNIDEMEKVVGKIENNIFIQNELKRIDDLKITVNIILEKLK